MTEILRVRNHGSRPAFIELKSYQVIFLRLLIRNVSNGEDIVMKSSGEQFRSWCYVVDCVSGLLYLLLKGRKGEAYNITDGKSNLSIRNLAEMIASIGNKNVRMEIPDSQEKAGYNVVRQSVYDTKKLQFLGWSIQGTMYQKMETFINE